MEIKELLYDEIDKIGKIVIRTKLSSDISNSKSLIDLLLNNCSNSLNKDNPHEDEYVSFSEVLLHFLLTVSMTPAERKIIIDDIFLDILIPNSKNLKMDSDKAVLIHFLKDKNENIIESIKKLSCLQKNINNIWIVSSSPSFLKNPNLNIPVFVVSLISQPVINDDDNKLVYSFSEILIKIDEFLKGINYTGLKIL